MYFTRVYSVLFFALAVSSAAIADAGVRESLYPAVSRILREAGVPVGAHAADRFEAERNPRPVTTQGGEAPELGIDGDGPLVKGIMVVFADDEAKKLSLQNLPPPVRLIDALESAAQTPLYYERAMSMGGFVFSFQQPLHWQEFEFVYRRLAKLAFLEIISPDTFEAKNVLPSDTYFEYQWGLFTPGMHSGPLGALVHGINAVQAWDITTGSTDTVVAVIDTGLVNPGGFGPGRILPGYDFISDPYNANDGDGRDADPADPGDFRAQGECAGAPEPAGSSWHGTHVAGIIGAPGNNNSGIAGIDWQTRILPVRVLGKCGGASSDVIDGMLWAAGFSIPGVPDNPNPARVLNLSLGGSAPLGCELSLYQQAINKIKSRNVLIVVAAGNDDVEASTFLPASCAGVVTVGAVDHLGYRASYSNWSYENRVFISAPGGDISYYREGPAGILSVVDAGEGTAEGRFDYLFYEGTSMAAPHVAGTASLALGIDPEQDVQMIAAIMDITSEGFAPDSRCALESPLCGSGIVDAYNTLVGVQALRPYRIVWEFYHQGLNHYFRTGNWDEIELVLQGRFGAWVDTSDYFLGWRDDSTGALPVCRFYGTPGIGPNSHFYTVDPIECEKVKQDPGWTYEGVPFYSVMHSDGQCPSDTTPVYRYYNMKWRENDSNHRYATHLDDRLAMEAEGWVFEGVAMCAPGD